jgi:urease accessory protein
MLLADARLPAGGHTQSGGLEPALRAGMPADDLPAYLVARLRTVVPTAAGAAVVVSRAVAGPKGDVVTTVAASWQEWAARTPSSAIRETEERLGRGYSRLLERLWGDWARSVIDAATALVGLPGEPRPAAPRPLVVGLLAGLTGLTGEQTARLVGYDDVQTIVSACLKLAPLDPISATGWTVSAFGEVEAMAHRVGGLTDPGDIPAVGAPQIDAWAQAHSVTRERLFSA